MATPGTYCPPVAHYRHFDVPSEWIPHIAQIIGRKGCHFIRLTERSGCDYIWYDRSNQRIEVWGPERSVLRGESMVRSWVSRCLST